MMTIPFFWVEPVFSKVRFACVHDKKKIPPKGCVLALEGIFDPIWEGCGNTYLR